MAPADGADPVDEGIEYDLCEATTADRPRCAFCLQPVEAALARTCDRCRTLYHPDCWKANDARCAVYGCDPVLPPPRRRRRIVFRTPAASRLGGRRVEIPLLAFFIVLVGGMYAFRFGTFNLGYSRGVETIEPAGGWPTPDNLDPAEALVGQARQFLAEFEKRSVPLKDPEAWKALRREADEAAGKLRKAVDLAIPHLPGHSELIDRLRSWSADLERLERLRESLSNP